MAGPPIFSLTPNYLLKVQGDSLIDDGILVGVPCTSDAQNGQLVVARVGGEITSSNTSAGAGNIRLLPRNHAHAPMLVESDQDFAIEGMHW